MSSPSVHSLLCCAGVLVIIAGCARAPVALTPPRAFLALPPPPIIPAADSTPATNIEVAEYLLDLHADSLYCRGQIRALNTWLDTRLDTRLAAWPDRSAR